MADRFSFVAPARTKVLVVPLGSTEEFSPYFERVRVASDIRLVDVSPIPSCRYFNPQAFPQGRVLYDYFVTSPEEETVFLHDFQPFRKTFIVLGVGKFLEADPRAVQRLAAQFPTAIVHNCIYFDTPADKTQSLDDKFYVGSLLNITSLETIMCSVTANYLLALDAYASSFENITLRLPVLLTDSNVLTRTINNAQKRLSSGSSFKVSFASTPGATAPDLKMKSLQKQTGRQAKLMGYFFLLAGRCNDALQYFTDAAINLKKSEDYLWLASALEGLAVASLMLLFLGLPYQVQNPMLASVLQIAKNKTLYPPNRSSIDSSSVKQSSRVSSPRNSTSSTLSFGFNNNLTSTDLAGVLLPEFLRLLCQRASQCYQLSTGDVENCVPDLVYVESLIRSIKFMTCVYLAGAEDPTIMEYVVKSLPVPKNTHKGSTWILKTDIIREIDKVFFLQLIDLEFTEQCRVYCALASIYADLGYPRKQAFILRILLVALLPKVAQIERENTAPGLASQASIREIFEFLFKVYHIDTETESLDVLALNHYSDWITLQLLLLKICFRIAEALRDYETLAKLCVLTLSRYTHCLPYEDQIKLKKKLDWLTLIPGDSLSKFNLPHPDPFMVRNAKFVITSTDNDLVPFIDHPNGTPLLTTERNPVIFNPFTKTKSTASKEKVICVNDVQQLKVTLQNPFSYEVDINDISAVADDEVKIESLKQLTKKFNSTSNSNGEPPKANGIPATRKPSAMNSVQNMPDSLGGFSLPPNSLTQVLVSFKALNAGLLKIKGFDVTFNNLAPQFFYIVEHETFSGLQKVKGEKQTNREQKDNIMDKLIDNLSGKKISHRAATKELSLTAIPPQPSLSVTYNLITNGWLMLLEGEKQEFAIELRNTSMDPINFLSFSFWDSTNDITSAKLNLNTVGSTLTSEDIYELEWQLLMNKPFTVMNKKDITSKYKIILPRGDVRIEYQINGKRNMTELKLILEYSNKNVDDLAKSYIKNVCVPLYVSVHASLEIIGCDVLPFFSSSLQGFTTDQQIDGNDLTQRNLKRLLNFIADVKDSEKDDISSYCLLVLDVRNLWKEKLVANISNKVHGVDFVVDEILDPTKTTRFLLPVKRISDEEIDVSRPIPSLRNKQFVKNYNITDEEEQQLRRNFWIRSALLENLSASWRTVGNGRERAGSIDVRCIRLSPGMANSLVYDKIQILHTVVTANKEEGVEKVDNEYRLKREKFYTLKTRILNHTKQSISGFLRHIPFPVNEPGKHDISIEQRILFNGILQRHTGSNAIEPGEFLEMKLGFMVLEKGRYEWGCVFDEFSQNKKTVGREPVYITAL